MRKLISLGVSAAILAAIYWAIDFDMMAAALARADAVLLWTGIAMVVPITLLTAWRLCILVPGTARPSLGEAVKLILAASSLNMVLPSKMGDVAKSGFMLRDNKMSGAMALSIVVFEKSCDMLALLIWCVFGLALFTGDHAVFMLLSGIAAACLTFGFLLLGSVSFANMFFRLAERAAPKNIAEKIAAMAPAWSDVHGYFWKRPSYGFGVIGFSVFLWGIHLIQIWLFALALGATISLISNLALAPLAIFAGLLPLTFAGIGTRDAALIVLFEPFMSATAGAALGLLCTLRYLMPAIAGLPFLKENLDAALRHARKDHPSTGDA